MALLVGAILIVVIALAFVAAWFFVQYQRMRREFPRPKAQVVQLRPNLDVWDDDGIYATWIGHSTVYMRVNGLRVLTDPVFSDQVGVGVGGFLVGPKRYTPPAITLDDIAANVDVILLSHAHLDHFDLPSLRKLATRGVHVVTAVGTGRLLRRLSFAEVVELGGTDRVELQNGAVVEAVPVRHWGRRFPWNRRYQWTGYVIRYQGASVFFAGDTAYADLSGVAQRPVHLAIMPIGAYCPDEFQASHCTPEQAWSMFLDTKAEWLLPVHWNTFVLSKEPVAEPLQRLIAAAGEDKDRIVVQEPGQEVRISL